MPWKSCNLAGILCFSLQKWFLRAHTHIWWFIDQRHQSVPPFKAKCLSKMRAYTVDTSRTFASTLQPFCHSMKNDELRNPFYLNLSKPEQFVIHWHRTKSKQRTLTTLLMQHNTHTNHVIEIYDVNFVHGIFGGHMQFQTRTPSAIWAAVVVQWERERDEKYIRIYEMPSCALPYRHIFRSQCVLVSHWIILILKPNHLIASLINNVIFVQFKAALSFSKCNFLIRKSWTLFINFSFNYFRFVSIVINYDKMKPVLPFAAKVFETCIDQWSGEKNEVVSCPLSMDII